jgi:hypothetical protein
MTNNLKDKLTTICSIILVLSGAVLTMQQNGILLPNWLLTFTGILSALSVAIIGYFTGKNPDGSKKEVPKNV